MAKREIYKPWVLVLLYQQPGTCVSPSRQAKIVLARSLPTESSTKASKKDFVMRNSLGITHSILLLLQDDGSDNSDFRAS